MFHSFRRVSMPYIPIVTNVIGIGNLAVDIFFFFSGLCLSLSARYHHYAENGWREYLIRRFDRVLVSYLILVIPYQIWNTVFDSYGSLIRRIAVFCGNISSATFCLKGTQTTWYLYAIVVFYLLFPMLYCFLIKSSMIIRASLIVGLIAMATVSVIFRSLSSVLTLGHDFRFLELEYYMALMKKNEIRQGFKFLFLC